MRTFTSFGTIATILSLLVCNANHAFALNQNSTLLPSQNQRNDVVNVYKSNIIKKFTLIADETVVKISPISEFGP